MCRIYKPNSPEKFFQLYSIKFYLPTISDTACSGTNIAGVTAKSRIMETSKNKNTAAGCADKNMPENQTPTSHEQPMHIPSVTQITPENSTLSGKKITPTAKSESPSQQELEQDVAATNPSVESMESRG